MIDKYRHIHDEKCEHDLKYCKHCDKAYCTKCNKEVSMNHVCTPCYLPHYYTYPKPYYPPYHYTNPWITWSTQVGNMCKSDGNTSLQQAAYQGAVDQLKSASLCKHDGSV